MNVKIPEILNGVADPARALTAVLVFVLAACASAPQIVTPPAQLAAIPAAEQFSFEHDLQSELRASLPDAQTGSVHALERADGIPSVRVDGTAFQGESSELQAAGLAPLASVAQLTQNAGPYIVHVIAESADPDKPQILADLPLRRAQAVAAVLAAQGLRADRIKVGSREQPGSEGGVMILLSPIVAGHESEALTPPPVEA